MRGQNRICSFLLAGLLGLSALTGCQGNGSSSGETEGADSALASLPEESSPDSESTESEAGTSGSGESSAGESSLSSEENSGALAESEEFNAKFAENPLDRQYQAESQEAVSNLEIAQVAEKYAGLWEEETEAAYTALMEASGEDAGWKAEQEAWLSSRQSELEKLSQQAAEIGGSLAQAEEATLRMEFFRQRARQLYRELYEYQPEFSFAWSPEAGSSDGEE